MRLTLREIRLIIERIVQAAGVAPGLLFAVRDAAVVSAILPVAGFANLPAEIAALAASSVKPATLSAGEDGVLQIDVAGQHPWLVTEALLDLAVERFRLSGRGEVLVCGAVRPSEFGVVAGLAEKHGFTAVCSEVAGGVLLEVRPRPARTESLLDHIRRKGYAVAADLWWPLYHASHAALAPDSFESRRHAGTIRVEADGRIVGRNDEDETDLSMLAADPIRLRPAPIP
ncbi:hypothetical protein [Bosea sp. TAB14]|uniref:hypothetical protein n=1 Tax=Bosea sp. TAB14 TaxID=3237481 RepID=UPI003F904EED